MSIPGSSHPGQVNDARSKAIALAQPFTTSSAALGGVEGGARQAHDLVEVLALPVRLADPRVLAYLFRLNEVLHKRVEDSTAPALVFQEATLRTRRAASSPRTSSARSSTTRSSTSGSSRSSRAPRPSSSPRRAVEEDDNLFEAYGVDPVIEGMLSRRVDLPSGGYLIIDYAEALTVIDINTGSYTGKGKAARLEDTITRTNLEAAEEVVNQLRLRDIGGIIVIDFIDMARARNRDAVLKVLRKALDEDRTKTFVVEISPLGLVEMTRQNVTDGRARS